MDACCYACINATSITRWIDKNVTCMSIVKSWGLDTPLYKHLPFYYQREELVFWNPMVLRWHDDKSKTYNGFQICVCSIAMTTENILLSLNNINALGN